MKSIFLLIFSIVFCSAVQSQDVLTTPTLLKNQLTFSTSYEYVNLYDKHFSPLPYTGNGIGINLSYSRENTSNAIIKIAAGGSLSSVQTSFSENFDSKLYRIDLSSSYLFLALDRDKFTMHLGPRVHGHLNVPLFELNGAIALSILTEYSADISTQMQYAINSKSSLRATMNLAVLSLVARPPYGTFNEPFSEAPINYALSKVKYVNPLDFQSLGLNIAYDYQLSRRWKLAANLSLTSQSISGKYPAQYHIYSASIDASYLF